MSRLADYFAVVGYDHDKEQTGLQGGSGKILQRFPEKDWEEVPFISGIELFCQPGGWKLVSKPHPPTFYVSVLTDIDALRHYCAVLTFFEATNMTPTKPDDLEGDEEETLVHHTLMFAPKSLVLISRLDYFDTLRNCLGLIYTVYIDSIDVPIETVVGNILGHIQVPPPGGPQVRFSIGAGDRQALQPPLTDTLPFSRNAVAMLTQQIGIHNTISLFSAALTDCKILFHSSSYSRLTDACHALQTLLFPVKYCYVYIPVLPAPLTEVLSTPTPFIMGIHSSLKQEMAELLDVIIADLDGGYIQIPECVNLLLPPDHMYDRIQGEITTVLRPDLRAADLAFPKLDDTQVKAEMLDKQIRAIFMRLQSELLMGYRICLTLIRIHPKPVIAFNKGKFLFHRSQVGDEFMSKVLDGMGFNTFVNERGPPYRVCDIFDRTIANIQNTLLEEEGHHSQERALKNIQEIAEHIFLNENPSKQQYLEKVPPPTDGAHTRIYQIPFPKLDGVKVQEVIEDGLAKALLQSINPKANKIRSPKAQIVPCGPQPTSFEEEMNRVNNSARRLEVLRNCISFIFENKIHDARKLFPAVLRSLKSRIARSALAQELGMHVQQNRAMLEQQQFDMVVRLINCALQEDSSSEEFSLTIEILPLALAFCRKLCTGVIQFAYSCVQDHPVWASLHFWETAFYIDVEENIKGLYVPSNTDSDYKAEVINDALVGNPDSTAMTNGYIQIGERSALDIAAEQMRIWPQLKLEMQEELINNEESIVYSQAIHYANRMVCMRVPLDISKGLKNSISIEGDSGGSSNVTGSVGGSDSYDGEITFEEPGHHDVANNVSKFISRFVDKVCTEAGVSQDHIKQLHSMIRNMVDMHIEMLDAVNKESKRLPPIKKPAILKPTLLPGEVKVGDGLRSYLLPDGREEGQGSSSGGLSFLPAEGAIFLTNYRIIFKGVPIDIQACEQVVTRSFPISSLYKEKKINVGQLSNTLHLEQFMSEGLQLRSTTFQLIRVAFDEEVGMEKVEVFRKNCSRYRFPQNIYQTYAFQGAVISPALTTQMKHKEKSATLRYMKFATKSFLRSSNKKSTLSRGGRPQSAKTMRKEKYLLPHEPLTMQRPPAATSTLPRNLMSGSLESVQTEANNSRPNSMLYDDDDLSNIDLACSTLRPQKGRTMSDASVIDETDVTNTLKPIDVLTADKLMDKKFVHDYERLGFGNPGAQLPSRPKQGEAFRISEVNIHFELSRSYPPLIVVPSALSDDSIRRLAKCHRQLRFPAIVWRHPRTKALLLRSSGFHGKGVMGMIKSSTSQNPRDSTGTESSTGSKSIEQDKFFSAIVFNTPYGSYHKSDSLVSLNAILPPSIGMDGPDTPTISPRKMHGGSSTLMHRGFLRSSGGKPAGSTMKPASGQSYKFLSLRRGSSMKMGTLRGFGFGGGSPALSHKTFTLGSQAVNRNGSITEMDLASSSPRNHDPRKAALYIFGEKSQSRVMKLEQYNKCDFIPYDYVETRHIKTSYKKLMKACLPSNTTTDPEMGFRKMVEESEWLVQVQSIMQLAGAVVDLMDLQGSSVMISFEDGWDFTTQVSSLAQLLMDPHYRTIEGFRVLIEKEWLAFGHRFTHRSNQTVAHQTSGFAPVFLQFLDCVHQVQLQFPMSFEYNQYFLQMLAYHYVSNRFQTFMLDSEYERFEASTQVFEDHKPHRIDETGDGASSSSKKGPIRCLWEYIDDFHKKSPLFYNLYYAPHVQVLRPYSNISSLTIWEYYLKEKFFGGPSFDRELFEKATAEDNEAPLMPNDRRIVDACYDSVREVQPDLQRWQLEEIRQLEDDIGHSPLRWKQRLDRLEQKFMSQRRRGTAAVQEAQSQSMNAHKKTTIDILIRGKSAGDSQPKGFQISHRFEAHSYMTPTECDLCSQLLYGAVKQGCKGMKCTDCGYNAHAKCVPDVPKQCSRRGSAKEPSSGPPRQVSEESSSVVGTPSTPVEPAMPEYSPTMPTILVNAGGISEYDQFHANIGETRTHEGYLYKRGARLKGWKQRWFVLDSQKHQLRYYETRNDQHCKGFIDLKEVESVQPVSYPPMAPKNCDKSAFFDLQTTRRAYNFLADTKSAADEWIRLIQDCLS